MTEFNNIPVVGNLKELLKYTEGTEHDRQSKNDNMREVYESI